MEFSTTELAQFEVFKRNWENALVTDETVMPYWMTMFAGISKREREKAKKIKEVRV